MAIYQQFNEEYIHSENSIDMKYSGFGPLIDFRVGVFIKGRVALFGNIFFEITDGYYDGVVDEENDEIVEKHIKKSAIAYGNGAGIQFFPLTSLSNDFANLYLGGSISVFMGGVENIGGFCGGFNLFLGNQWSLSKRTYVGIEVSVSVFVISDESNEATENGSGYSIGIGFTFSRR